MAAWALSALQAQTPELWAAELAFVAACPPESLDEVRQLASSCVLRSTPILCSGSYTVSRLCSLFAEACTPSLLLHRPAALAAELVSSAAFLAPPAGCPDPPVSGGDVCQPECSHPTRARWQRGH